MATTASSGAEPQPQIDKGALLAKYRAERDKRLRAGGNAQYLSLKGRFADEPYTPVAQREAKTDHVTFAFIGGGFAGLATCARMVEAGVQGAHH
jgi:cyclohexanone monooxygenase